MSKKKKSFNTPKKKGKYKISHSGVIHGQNSIYTNKAPIGQHMNSCKYHDKESHKCTNSKCHTTICTTAHGCTCYKRKEDIQNKKSLSEYDENYIQIPNQSGTHETDNSYIGISKNIGTPCHVGYIKSDGIRRHKARCIHYDKIRKMCTWFIIKCTGSSKCNKYCEK